MKRDIIKISGGGAFFSFLRGFTLAEILITLGIIGVVAAITLPVFIKNYQEDFWLP